MASMLEEPERVDWGTKHTKRTKCHTTNFRSFSLHPYYFQWGILPKSILKASIANMRHPQFCCTKPQFYENLHLIWGTAQIRWFCLSNGRLKFETLFITMLFSMSYFKMKIVSSSKSQHLIIIHSPLGIRGWLVSVDLAFF